MLAVSLAILFCFFRQRSNCQCTHTASKQVAEVDGTGEGDRMLLSSSLLTARDD